MEVLLAQCSQLFSAGNSPVLLSVVMAGLVGSMSHCSVMCAPLVAAQMLHLKQQGHAQHHMLYYHAGRLSTYMLLGALAVLASGWVFSGALHQYSNALLVLAGMAFFASAAMPRKTHSCNQQSPLIRTVMAAMPHPALAHYLRGMLMGFMPCGMIIAVLLIVATLTSAAHAALAMLLFGVSTIPILQLTGLGVLRIGARYPQFSARAGRSVMALNGIFLCGLGLNFVRVY